MADLVLAAILFLGIHFLSSSPLRQKIVARTGEGAYRGMFSLISVVAIIFLVRAYNQAPPGDVFWQSTVWTRWVALVAVFIGMVFVVCGITLANPTAAGFEKALHQAEPGRGILRITRHPFLWGTVLWATAHGLNNGDAASIIFFGTFAVLAALGTWLIDEKTRKSDAGAYALYKAVTSNIPFAAIVDGRNHLSLAEIGWWRLGLSVVIFVVILVNHAALFGVDPRPF